MNIYTELKTLGLPVAYGKFSETPTPPYIAYMGAGQNNTLADDKNYQSTNRYRIEYYFKTKDESRETLIETLLSKYVYTKSEDVYIEGEDLFVIYYEI